MGGRYRLYMKVVIAVQPIYTFILTYFCFFLPSSVTFVDGFWTGGIWGWTSLAHQWCCPPICRNSFVLLGGDHFVWECKLLSYSPYPPLSRIRRFLLVKYWRKVRLIRPFTRYLTFFRLPYFLCSRHGFHPRIHTSRIFGVGLMTGIKAIFILRD